MKCLMCGNESGEEQICIKCKIDYHFSSEQLNEKISVPEKIISSGYKGWVSVARVITVIFTIMLLTGGIMFGALIFIENKALGAVVIAGSIIIPPFIGSLSMVFLDLAEDISIIRRKIC